MIKSWKNPLLCLGLTVILVALLMHATAFAGAQTYGREKLTGTTKSQEDLARQQAIAEAQNLTSQAYGWVVSAEKHGNWDGMGHAKKAEALLLQAQNELKLAAAAPAPK